MSSISATVSRTVHLSPDRADRLRHLALLQATSEDQIINKALDILFSLTDVLDTQAERRGWSYLSEDSLNRVWDNDADAAYDNWREVYGVQSG